MAGSSPLDPVDVIVGNMALQQRLVDDGQLAEARMMCSMKSDASLAQVLYGLGYISIQQAEKLEHAATVIRVREEDKLLCEMAVKRKIISTQQAEEVLGVQKAATRNPGQVPRVKELLINREYVKGPLVDILMDLVQQVSPYSKPASKGPPVDQRPQARIGSRPVEEKPAAKQGDTVKHVKPAEAPGSKADAPVRPSGDHKATEAKASDVPKVAPRPGEAGKPPIDGPAPAGEAPKTEGKGFVSAVERLTQLRKLAAQDRPTGDVPVSKGDTAIRRAPARPAEPAKPAEPAAKAEDKSPSLSLVPREPGDSRGDRIARGQIFTQAVHAGHTHACEPTIDPIVPSVTYDFPTMEALEEFLKSKDGFWYSRHGNPTVRAAEEKIAALEGSEDAVLAASGMSALTAALLTLLRPGDTIATTDGLYGGTWHLFNDVLVDFNITLRRVPAKDWLLIREHVAGTTKLIYFEPVTNPMLRIWDPRPPVKDAKRLGILTMVDNTFATPFNLRPIEMGVDLVFHSATKYLGGHGDVTAGVVCGRKDLIARIRERLKLLGPTLSAFDAWLLIRGLKTFGLRMRAQNENALYIAQALARNPKVKNVWHPGLESHPDHAVAKEILKGWGGMVTFEVEGGLARAKEICNHLQIVHRAVSLGGVESLASIPVLSSHHGVPDKELERAGIPAGCIRLSVGIEDPDDVLEDLEQALQ